MLNNHKAHKDHKEKLPSLWPLWFDLSADFFTGPEKQRLHDEHAEKRRRDQMADM
jgi:hypothetical protein